MDRVRFGSTYGTSPCVQLLAASEDEEGCGRPFVPPPFGDYEVEDAPEPTATTEFDAEFGFTSDVEAKKIWMQCVSTVLKVSRCSTIGKSTKGPVLTSKAMG